MSEGDLDDKAICIYIKNLKNDVEQLKLEIQLLKDYFKVTIVNHPARTTVEPLITHRTGAVFANP